jgi:hypothetical protein
MEKLATQNADNPSPEPPREANRGWFTAGDGRINRGGRPRGRKAAAGETRPVAKRADCIKVLMIPARDLVWRLKNKLAPWIVNFPADLEIVDCEVDEDSDMVHYIVRSKRFPRIAAGSIIPPFSADFNGLIFRCRD